MSLSVVRSALFVPGSRPERFAKALASGADAVIVDFEDAVEEALKTQARDNLRDFLTANPRASLWVRINSAEHRQHAADIAFCNSHAGVSHIVLPKAEDRAQVGSAAAGGKPIVPIIESARGIVMIGEIASHPAVRQLSFGGIDYALDLALNEPSPAASFALDQARLAVVVHSRAAGLIAPLDGVFPGINDAEGLGQAVRHAYDMGFGGALCIHPRQVETIHSALRPSPADLAWARRVVEGAAQGAGAFQLDGQMIDAPVLQRAQRLLARAG